MNEPDSAMKFARFDWPLVRRLVLKDWHVQRVSFVLPVAFDVLAVLAFLIILRYGRGGFTVPANLILLMLTLVMMHFVSSMELDYQQRENSIFVKSLPISRHDRLAARLLALVLPFLPAWSVLLALGWLAASPGQAAEVLRVMAFFLGIYVVLMALCVVANPYMREGR
jgi:hypothetical protein